MEKFNNCYFIALYNGQPAGYVGVINDDIRVATHPDFQKLGIGKAMITFISEKFPNSFAKIKINNISSLMLFEKSGFSVKYHILTKD